MPDPWASEGGACPLQDFEIISKKGCFFQFRGLKTKCHHFWPPLEKILEKSPTAPPGKNLSDAHGQTLPSCFAFNSGHTSVFFLT